MRPSLKKAYHKKVVVEWLKVRALSSNPSTAKQQQQQKSLQFYFWG
jgi:hypothetical protein